MNNPLKFKNIEPFGPEKRKQIESPELTEGMKKLTAFLESTAKSMRAEGVPVKSDCRIDLEAFQNCYPAEVLSRDRQRIAKIQKEWREEALEKEKVGERLEMLKTAVFNKFLEQKFIVVRTNLADDIDNGVDNIIMEKQTGNVVCAFDDVADISGPIYQDKMAKTSEKNLLRSGAHLKYGLGIDTKTKKITPQPLQHIPIFYLALPGQYIEETIKQFQPQLKNQQETKLFSYFISSIQTQLKALDLKISALPQEMREKIETFDRAIQKYSLKA